MDSPEIWQLSIGLNGISTNSINEVFQISASTEYSWLKFRLSKDPDKDNEAA